MNFRDIPAIGTPIPHEGGNFGGAFRYPDGTIRGAIWAPKAEGEIEGILLPSHKMVKGATSCIDSLANTIALAEAGSPLAQWARGLRIAGKDDWAVAARDIYESAYRHLKPSTYDTCCSFRDGDNPSSIPVGYPYTEASPILQTTVDAFKQGGPEAFELRDYHSSSQYSADSGFVQNFHDGNQYSLNVAAARPSRAVRMILLNP